MKKVIHVPVMHQEVVKFLNLRPGNIVVDTTVGMGGHAECILEKISPGGKLIGIDKDLESLEICRQRLKKHEESYHLIHGDFRDIDTILDQAHIARVDAMLFDLGISSYQLGTAQRGFSFQSEGPLDMRMDKDSFISAYDLVNNLNQDEISSLLWRFGQERWHNRIARNLVREREKAPISTTTQLANLVVRAMPYRYRHYRIHPATRTFQALRIAVNRELESLEEVINKAVSFLNFGARICFISFHSLEDRIVKLKFRKLSSEGVIKILTKKPLRPTEKEVEENPPSRSAKLRVAQKI